MKTKLGGYLRRIRLKNGEILKDMAERLGVTSAFLSAVENGKKNMPEKWVDKLKELYHLTETERDELEVCAMESRHSIEINLKNATGQNRELAILFARSFENMSVEASGELMEYLKRSADKADDRVLD